MKIYQQVIYAPQTLPDKRFWYYEYPTYLEVVVTESAAKAALERSHSGFFIKIPRRKLKATLRRMERSTA